MNQRSTSAIIIAVLTSVAAAGVSAQDAEANAKVCGGDATSGKVQTTSGAKDKQFELFLENFTRISGS